jgi:hypothetical protein
MVTGLVEEMREVMVDRTELEIQTDPGLGRFNIQLSTQ